jgi:pilus assembly protein Flp/PilA
MIRLVTRFIQDENGATAIEYGLIVALISVVIITAVSSVGNSLKSKFNTINSSL